MNSSGLWIAPSHPIRWREVRDRQFPCYLSCWDSDGLTLPDRATHFGYVHSGSALIRWERKQYELEAGMYFSLPGAMQLEGDGIGFVASRVDYRGFFQIGGPIEQTGRLRYIDGCSDSLLISPVVLGDPCLNFLYLPPHTRQTQHTHPSCRLGMIASGAGTCLGEDASFPLRPGMLFELSPETLHSFHTENEALRVIAWHPDSDCGPAHNNHPMINRTIIDGVSARFREEDHPLPS